MPTQDQAQDKPKPKTKFKSYKKEWQEAIIKLDQLVDLVNDKEKEINRLKVALMNTKRQLNQMKQNQIGVR